MAVIFFRYFCSMCRVSDALVYCSKGIQLWYFSFGKASFQHGLGKYSMLHFKY